MPNLFLFYDVLQRCVRLIIQSYAKHVPRTIKKYQKIKINAIFAHWNDANRFIFILYHTNYNPFLSKYPYENTISVTTISNYSILCFQIKINHYIDALTLNILNILKIYMHKQIITSIEFWNQLFTIQSLCTKTYVYNDKVI